MKKFLCLLSLACLLGASAEGRQSSWNKTEQDAMDDVESKVGTTDDFLSGSGTTKVKGYLSNKVTASATTITAAQCGSTFVALHSVQMELPAASGVVGCELTFIVGNTGINFDINPDDADQILNATAAAGEEIRGSTLGHSVTLVALSNGEWGVKSEEGTFTNNG